jgi:hypothetical protein
VQSVEEQNFDRFPYHSLPELPAEKQEQAFDSLPAI